MRREGLVQYVKCFASAMLYRPVIALPHLP